MNRIFSKLLAIGLILVLASLIIAVIGLSIVGWDFTKISGISITEGSYTELGEITEINVKVDTSEVSLVFDETAEAVTVTYNNEENKSGETVREVSVTEADGKLTISEKINWKRSLGLFNFNNTRVTVTLPTSRIYTLNIETDTGDVSVKGSATATTAKFETDTGDIYIEKINTGLLSLSVDTGDITLKDTSATLMIDIETNTGDVLLGGALSSPAVKIETDTGDVKINGTLTAQTVKIETDTGDVKEGLVDAASITLISDTGDFKLKLVGKSSDYKTSVSLHTGDTNVSKNLSGDKSLDIRSDTGDVYIYFTEN